MKSKLAQLLDLESLTINWRVPLSLWPFLERCPVSCFCQACWRLTVDKGRPKKRSILEALVYSARWKQWIRGVPTTFQVPMTETKSLVAYHSAEGRNSSISSAGTTRGSSWSMAMKPVTSAKLWPTYQPTQHALSSLL